MRRLLSAACCISCGSSELLSRLCMTQDCSAMGINGLIEFFRLCKVIKNGNTRCEEEPEDHTKSPPRSVIARRKENTKQEQTPPKLPNSHCIKIRLRKMHNCMKAKEHETLATIVRRRDNTKTSQQVRLREESVRIPDTSALSLRASLR